MKVRAVMRGYYRWLRQPGEEFEIPDHLHSPYVPGTTDGGWQEKIEDSAPASSPPSAAEPTPAPVEPAVPDSTEADEPDAQWDAADDQKIEAEDAEDEATPGTPRKKK